MMEMVMVLEMHVTTASVIPIVINLIVMEMVREICVMMMMMVMVGYLWILTLVLLNQNLSYLANGVDPDQKSVYTISLSITLTSPCSEQHPKTPLYIGKVRFVRVCIIIPPCKQSFVWGWGGGVGVGYKGITLSICP